MTRERMLEIVRFCFVGGVSFLLCSFMAISQTNAKRVLAYSTIANLGLITACAGVGTPEAVWAGVFLIIKLAPVLGYNMAGIMVMVIGGLTFLLASFAAISQSNAKRVQYLEASAAISGHRQAAEIVTPIQALLQTRVDGEGRVKQASARK